MIPTTQQKILFLLSTTAIVGLVSALTLTTYLVQQETRFPFAAEDCITKEYSGGDGVCVNKTTAEVSLTIRNNCSTAQSVPYTTFSKSCPFPENGPTNTCTDCSGQSTEKWTIVSGNSEKTITADCTIPSGSCGVCQVDIDADPQTGQGGYGEQAWHNFGCDTTTPTPTPTPTLTTTPPLPPTATPTLTCPIPQSPTLSASSACWEEGAGPPTITLNWNDVEDENGYEIYQKINIDQWELIDTVNKNTTDYQAQGPLTCTGNDAETTWGIKAISPCGSSPIDADQARTNCCTLTPTPTPLTCKDTCNPNTDPDPCGENLSCQEEPVGSNNYFCFNTQCLPSQQDNCQCITPPPTQPPTPTPTPSCPTIPQDLDFRMHCVRDGGNQALRNIEFMWKNFARFWSKDMQEATQLKLALHYNVVPREFLGDYTTTMYDLINQGASGGQKGCGAATCWYQFENQEMESYWGRISARFTNACSSSSEAEQTLDVSAAGCGDPSSSVAYQERADMAQKDINQDGTIGPADASLLVRCWASRKGEAKFNPQADINDDLICNALDASILVSYWGLTY